MTTPYGVGSGANLPKGVLHAAAAGTTTTNTSITVPGPADASQTDLVTAQIQRHIDYVTGKDENCTAALTFMSLAL